MDRYVLFPGRQVNDPVVGDEGGLTTTRDYHTYAEAFAASAAANGSWFATGRAGSSTSAAARARCWNWPTGSRRCGRAT